MADVLKIALDRRSELQDEVTKLDEFIRMAEMLIRTAKERGEKVEAMPATKPTVQAEEETAEMPQRPSQVAENSMRTALRRAEADADADSVARPSVIRRSLTGSPG